MVDVGKREDRMLDVISEQKKQIAGLERSRDETVEWLKLYKESGMIHPLLHEHLELIALGY